MEPHLLASLRRWGTQEPSRPLGSPGAGAVGGAVKNRPNETGEKCRVVVRRALKVGVYFKRETDPITNAVLVLFLCVQRVVAWQVSLF